MVWVTYGLGSSYVLSLTDGYLLERGRQTGASNIAERLGRRVVQRGTLIIRTMSCLDLDTAYPVHAWAIGPTESASAFLRGLAEGDTSDRYRLLIIGEGGSTHVPADGTATLASASFPAAWVRQEGMRYKKRRTHYAQLREHGELLLSLMHDYYFAHGRAAIELVESFEAPYDVFVGSYGKSLDSCCVGRIQQ